jgi:hypothetical protein
MKTHRLKTWPEVYEAILTRAKTFDVRRDDRGFAVGDQLVLREWRPDTGEYTGRSITVLVTYLLAGGQFGVAPGYVCMSIRRVPSLEKKPAFLPPAATPTPSGGMQQGMAADLVIMDDPFGRPSILPKDQAERLPRVVQVQTAAEAIARFGALDAGPLQGVPQPLPALGSGPDLAGELVDRAQLAMYAGPRRHPEARTLPGGRHLAGELIDQLLREVCGDGDDGEA